jgi:transcription initiation factor TFIID subunit TAF12
MFGSLVQLFFCAPVQFCYTGRMGLLGNLTTAQIVEQLVEARRWLAHYTTQQQQQQQQQVPELHQLHQHHHQQPQQQQWLNGNGVQQAGAGVQHGNSNSSSSHKSKKKPPGWQEQPPRINNIVFMVSSTSGFQAAAYNASTITSSFSCMRCKTTFSLHGEKPTFMRLHPA